MAVNIIDRARIIMARIKDDSEPDNSKISAAIATKYADAFVGVFRSPGLVASLTNTEKSIIYIAELKRMHKDILKRSRVPVKAIDAEVSERALIDTEFAAEFGT